MKASESSMASGQNPTFPISLSSQNIKGSKLAFDGLRKKYDFRWEVLDIIIGGQSSIDSPNGFQIHTVEDADRFVRSYGYNLENPIENAEAFGNFHEAMNFIRKNFMQPENPDGLKIEVPRKILELTDIRNLFLMASMSFPAQSSDTHGLLIRNWACSILKIMHTIAHIDQDLRSSYYSDIQTQIFDRYYKLIQRDQNENLYLGERPDDPDRVDLVAFETKSRKARESILLKLLHKPENVAEDIFDRVGMRFVTHTRLDCVRIVKYLRDRMIVMPPNIKPSRSRNSLIDLDMFRDQLPGFLAQADRGELDEKSLTEKLEAVAHATRKGQDNPHSSQYYRAIQFTARQLIKLKHPMFDDLRELKTHAKSKTISEDVARLIERIDLKNIQKDIRFFYPYEVQIMDKVSFEENEKGRSAHSEYKRAQIQTAMKRVMGSLMDAVR